MSRFSPGLHGIHPVISAIAARANQESKFDHRDDDHKIALVIEGGGCVASCRDRPGVSTAPRWPFQLAFTALRFMPRYDKVLRN